MEFPFYSSLTLRMLSQPIFLSRLSISLLLQTLAAFVGVTKTGFMRLRAPVSRLCIILFPLLIRYYNAPEIILGIRKLTYAVDVWSFAITWLRIMGIWICEPFQKGAHISELSFCEKLFNLLNEKPSPEVWSVFLYNPSKV